LQVGNAQRFVGFIISLGLLLPVACSKSGNEANVDSETTSGKDKLSDGAFDPIDGMKSSQDQVPISPADLIVIFKAEQRLVDDCMAEQGFDMATNRYDGPVRTMAPPFLSPAELRRSGYQFDWDADAAEYLALNGPEGPPNPTEGMSEEEANAFGDALDGGSSAEFVEMKDLDGGTVSISLGGCSGEARVALYGSAENSIRFNRAAEQVTGTGYSRKLFTKEKYRVAAEEWQKCMGQAGYEVGPKTDALGKKSNGYDYGLGYLTSRQATQLSMGQGALARAEIDAVAAADAACQESTGLHDVRNELLPGVKDDVAEELGFEMSQYVAFQHAVLERAKAVR
jgi:hypothetical protein